MAPERFPDTDRGGGMTLLSRGVRGVENNRDFGQNVFRNSKLPIERNQLPVVLMLGANVPAGLVIKGHLAITRPNRLVTLPPASDRKGKDYLAVVTDTRGLAFILPGIGPGRSPFIP